MFINFRGDELRKGFVGFLVEALKREKVNVFVDDHELRGRELDHLFIRIENPKVAQTIFSERYTQSIWCLDELIKIKERMNQGNLQVIPIFYKVSSEDVKRLKGQLPGSEASEIYFVKVIVEEVKKVLTNISREENRGWPVTKNREMQELVDINYVEATATEEEV
ncbi:hypothetical protein EUTSA_v10024080mg, partial [Eutrema salsugineum]